MQVSAPDVHGGGGSRAYFSSPFSSTMTEDGECGCLMQKTDPAEAYKASAARGEKQ